MGKDKWTRNEIKGNNWEGPIAHARRVRVRKKKLGGGMSEEGAMGRLELEKQIGEAENIKRTQNW